METNEKFENLKSIIKSYAGLAVAFSGGVDSSFLLKVTHDVLGERVIAITARPSFFTEKEQEEAENFCKAENITHIFCDTDELSIEGVAKNRPDRCYLCKNEILTKIKQAAAPYNPAYIADGSNFDDDADYRPGFLAVLEHGIKSPLREVGLTKAEIRSLSKQLGLPTWDKKYRSCLASRFPYGEVITKQKLAMVEKAEELLFDLGFSQLRVRIHGTVARIEIEPAEFSKITKPEISQLIYNAFKEYGFGYTALDLCGYRTGSMNEMIKIKKNCCKNIKYDI